MTDTLESTKCKRWSVRKYILIYTAVFALFMIATYATFICTGKSWVWKEDGGGQYFIYLSYVGSYLRDMFRRMLQGDFTLRMFDFTIGPGSDVNSIFRTHPLDYLSVLVPLRYTELLYHVINILNLYIAGLLFYVFGRMFDKKDEGILAGSILYLFCGYTMRPGTEHPQFLLALVILPLILIAGEYMMTGRKPLLFAFAVFFGFFSNYYMMYMATVALGVYILLRFPVVCRTDRLKQFFVVTFRFGVWYLLGTAMAMISLWPTVQGLGSSARLKVDTARTLFIKYPGFVRYFKWLSALITPQITLGYDTPLNYLVLALPVLAILFFGKARKRITVCLAAGLCIIMMLVPAGSYIMTAFSTVNCRWIYIFSFVIGFAAAEVWEELTDPDRRTKIVIGAAWAVWMLVTFLLWRSNVSWYVLCAAAELTVCTVVLIWGHKVIKTKNAFNGVLLGGSLISCALAGGMLYSSWFGGFVNSFLDGGEASSRILNSTYTRPSVLESDGFSRTEFNYVGNTQENYGIYLGYNSTAMYNSLLSGPFVDFLYEEENTGLNAIHRTHDLDGRTVAEALMDVEWYITRNESGSVVPYGYELDQEHSDDKVLVYRNQQLLPIGYTYPAAVLAEDTEDLSALEKQQLMLDAAKVEELPEGVKTIADTETGVLETQIELPEGTETAGRTSDGYLVYNNGGSVTFEIPRKAGYECYIRFEGLYRNVARARVIVNSDNVGKSFIIRGLGQTYSLGRKDYLVNMGTETEDRTQQVTLTFESKGRYQLSGIKVMYAPMEGYEEKIAALSEHSLEDVQVGINTVTGTVDVPENRIMAFSIPFSKGWSAYVDGEKTPVYRVNTGFVGMTVPEGQHEIRLSYTTPGAVTGRLASAFGWIVWGACAFVLRRKKRKGALV